MQSCTYKKVVKTFSKVVIWWSLMEVRALLIHLTIKLQIKQITFQL